MTTFKRARSEEQRAERRRRILDTAAAMLTEMPVAQVSLNELSRRVCLAKSNVLRYFESREAVLLELLDLASREWIDQWAGTLAADVDATADPRTRCDQLAASLAASVAARPVLCDLVSAQAAVLEHNVSTQVAIKYKRSSVRTLELLTELVLAHLPELGTQDAGRFVATAVLVVGALWPYARPAAAILAAYESEPALAALRIDFPSTLRDTLAVFLSGLLARAAVNP